MTLLQRENTLIIQPATGTKNYKFQLEK